MIKRKAKILAVDDEAFNLDILQNDLEGAGFEVVRAENGKLALLHLAKHPDVDLIVLDRMMPQMDGIEMMKLLKSNPLHRDIPIVMQTAAAQSHQVVQGLQAGAYYYLVKPYNEELLLSIVRAALRDARASREMRDEVSKQKQVLGLIDHARFRFRTLEDAGNVAYYVANCCPHPETVVYGLSELMINAVEHGNLKITYAEKTKLVLENRWQQEVERRLAMSEHRDKFATLTFDATGRDIVISIRDQGEGFDWEYYLDFDPIRMTDPNGRGIAMVKVTCFPTLEYKDGGREAVCRLVLADPDDAL